MILRWFEGFWATNGGFGELKVEMGEMGEMGEMREMGEMGEMGGLENPRSPRSPRSPRTLSSLSRYLFPNSECISLREFCTSVRVTLLQG